MDGVGSDRAARHAQPPTNADRPRYRSRLTYALLALAGTVFVAHASAAPLTGADRPESWRDSAADGRTGVIDLRTYASDLPTGLSPSFDTVDQLVRIDRLAAAVYAGQVATVAPHRLLAVVPEPETVALLFAGMAAFVASWRRSHRFLRRILMTSRARFALSGRRPGAPAVGADAAVIEAEHP